MQTLTLAMLDIDPASDGAYSKVRVDWSRGGAPAWKVTDDVCFLRCAEDDDEYNRIREVKLTGRDDVSLTRTTTYTRVWRVNWILYGPNSFDHARMVRSALFGPLAHDALAASNLYFIPTPAAPVRLPELFSGNWWERTDFSARFNEAVTEVETISSIASAEIIVETERGIVEDITVQPQ